MSESLSGGGPVASAPNAPATNAPEPSGSGAAQSMPDFKESKHRVKVNGAEKEIPYDELVRGYQTTQAAQQKFQEAQRLSTEAQKINQALESGDFKFIAQKLGPERARKLSEEYLIEQLQEDARPQHEKDLRTERQKREDLERQIKERDESEQRQRYDDLAKQAYNDLDLELSEALKAVGKKPNPRLALRMIEQIEAAMKGNGERIPATKAWEQSRLGIIEDIGLIAPDLSYAEAREMFGAKTLDRWMQEKVGRVMDERGQRPQVRRREPEERAEKAPDRPLTLEEKFANIEKKLKRR